MTPWWARHQLLVCVGPGGAGKTTIAASFGVAAARQGKKVLVLTIDPARRLADALGVTQLGDARTRVPVPGGSGELWAAMVETSSSYDRLIGRLVGNPERRDAILTNPMYRAFSRTLGRSHAYVAMERLHDAVEDGGFDLIVLDTPPAKNAVEILDAPRRLTSFLDHGLVKWLLPGRPQATTGRFIYGGRAARAMLAALIGDRLLDEAVAFFGVFRSLRDVFTTRARKVERMLREDGTGFVIVTTPTPGTLTDTVSFAQELEGRGISPVAAVFNRSYEIVDEAAPQRVGPAPDDEPTPRPEPPEALRAVWEKVEGLYADVVRKNRQSLAATAELEYLLPTGCELVFVPFLDDATQPEGHGLDSVPGLLRVEPFLVSDTPQ